MEETLLCGKRVCESSGRTGRGEAEGLWVPVPALKQQEKSTFVCLAIRLLHRPLKAGGERGEEEEEEGMNGEDDTSLSSICKWSVSRMHIEMPCKAERTYKVARTQPISQFTPVKQEHSTQNSEMAKQRAYLLN